MKEPEQKPLSKLKLLLVRSFEVCRIGASFSILTRVVCHVITSGLNTAAVVAWNMVRCRDDDDDDDVD